MTEIVFAVEGMHCASCGLLIDETVEKLDGVEQCETDVRRARSRVTYDPDQVSAEMIEKAIEDAGYKARRAEPET